MKGKVKKSVLEWDDPVLQEQLKSLRQPEQVEKQETPPIQFLMRTYHNRVKQEQVKRKRLECVRAGEKVMLGIQTNKQK